MESALLGANPPSPSQQALMLLLLFYVLPCDQPQPGSYHVVCTVIGCHRPCVCVILEDGGLFFISGFPEPSTVSGTESGSVAHNSWMNWGFSALALLTFSVWQFLLGLSCVLLQCSGFYPVGASSTPPAVTAKSVSICYQMYPGDKITPGWEPLK